MLRSPFALCHAASCSSMVHRVTATITTCRQILQYKLPKSLAVCESNIQENVLQQDVLKSLLKLNLLHQLIMLKALQSDSFILCYYKLICYLALCCVHILFASLKQLISKNHKVFKLRSDLIISKLMLCQL